MTETVAIVQPAYTDVADSQGAVSIFFGKASIQHVKEIVRKRPTSLPRQYPDEDTKEFSRPGSVSKKAAFFDQYIRCSSLERTAGNSESGGNSENKINVDNAEEMWDLTTRGEYADDRLSVSHSLEFSAADESLLKDVPRIKSSAFVSNSSTLKANKVEEEEFLQHMGNAKLPVVIASHDSVASPTNSAQVGSFQANYNAHKKGHNVCNKVTGFQTDKKVVQVEKKSLFELLSVRKEHEVERDPRRPQAAGIQMQISSDYKQERIKPEDSASMENGTHNILRKVPFQRKKASIYSKTDQPSSLVVPTSPIADVHMKNKDERTVEAKGASRVRKTTTPVNSSNTFVVASHANLHGSPSAKAYFSKLYGPHQHSLIVEKRNSSTKKLAGTERNKQIATTGNDKISSTSTGRNMEVTPNMSVLTSIKASYYESNGK